MRTAENSVVPADYPTHCWPSGDHTASGQADEAGDTGAYAVGSNR
jgi:hypothetical protein